MIALVNKSTLLTAAQMAILAALLTAQDAQQFAPAYGLVPETASVCDQAQVPKGTQAIVFVDDADEPGALGYHVDEGGFASSIVGVKTIYDSGGTFATGSNSVTVTAGHEWIEMRVDPATNRWRDNGAGGMQIEEPGDPVENDSGNAIGITDPTTGEIITCACTNFVRPAYFDPQSKGPYDYLGTLTAPFTLSAGGYVSLQSAPEDVHQIQAKHAGHEVHVFTRGDGSYLAHLVFGQSYPSAKKMRKVYSGRVARACARVEAATTKRE